MCFKRRWSQANARHVACMYLVDIASPLAGTQFRQFTAFPPYITLRYCAHHSVSSSAQKPYTPWYESALALITYNWWSLQHGFGVGCNRNADSCSHIDRSAHFCAGSTVPLLTYAARSGWLPLFLTHRDQSNECGKSYDPFFDIVCVSYHAYKEQCCLLRHFIDTF